MARPTSIRAKRPLAVALVALIVLGSGALAAVVTLREQRSDERQGEALAREARGNLNASLVRMIAGLRAAAGIVSPAGAVTPEAFQAYGRGILEQPGLAALALQEVVPHAERARFERQLGREIVDIVAPGRFERAPRREVYYVVSAVQPDVPRNRSILGVDISVDPLRSGAARLARDRGTPHLTAPIPLNTTGRTGVLVVAPLYRIGAPVGSVDERREALVGFVTAAYGAPALGEVARAGLPDGTAVSVVDDGRPLVGDARIPAGAAVQMRAAGRVWSVHVQRQGSSEYLLGGLVLGSGALLATLAWGLFSQAMRRERALQAARQEERRARREALDAGRRAAALQALTAGLARCRTREDVVTTALERAGATFDPVYALAGLVETAPDRLRLTGSVGVPGGLRADAAIRLDAPLAVCRVVSTGAPISLAGKHAWEDAVPADVAPPEQVGAGACLPLAGATGVWGVLVLGSDVAADWSPQERELAEAMAAQIGQALERTRLEEQEQELVATLQRTLLPLELPHVDGVDLAGCYEPGAEGLNIGGDWYDAIALPDGRVGLAVGDVVGHGPAAAAVMGQLRSALRAFMLEGRDPASALGSLAQFAADPSHATGATAVCAVLDAVSGELEYARAGHPPPLRVRLDGTWEMLDEARGIPLGVFAGLGYTTGRASLRHGDVLVLYSDGAVERRGEAIDEGIARLAAAVAAQHGSAQEVCDGVRDALRAEVPFTDDVALLVARRAH